MIVERNMMMMMTNSIRITNDQNSLYKATMNKRQLNRAVMAVEQWSHTEVYTIISMFAFFPQRD